MLVFDTPKFAILSKLCIFAPMNRHLRILCLAYLFGIVAYPVSAQTPSKKGVKQFNAAKNLFALEKYAEARILFAEVQKNPKNFDLRADARFYTAVSLMKENNHTEAAREYENLLQDFPAFAGKEDVRYMLAEMQFQKREYLKALQTLESLKNEALASQITNMKGYFLRPTDMNTLRGLFEKYPKDKLIAQLMVDKMAVQATQEAEVEAMESLIKELSLEKPTAVRFERKIFTKPTYKVAVLLPFDFQKMKNRDTTTLNRISIAMYQGMRIAKRELDTLNGAKVHLFVYEIGKNDKAKLEKLIQDKEFEDIDAFIGPLYDTLYKSIVDILPKQKTILLNPISVDGKLASSPYTYLYEPSTETQAQKVVEFLGANAEKDNKNMVIFFDDLKKNKNLASLVKQKAETMGFKILAFEEVSASDYEAIQTTLRKYNRFEVGCMFVASTSNLIAQEITKQLQAENYQVPVIVPEAWLRIQSIEYEVYEKLKIHILYPEYLDTEDKNPSVTKFKLAYANLVRQELAGNNLYPYIGYELIHYLAKTWEKAGTQADYKKVFEKTTPYQTKTHDWLDYRAGKQDNQFVPILRFKKVENEVEIELANQPK